MLSQEIELPERSQLESGLQLLGELLEQRGLAFHLVLVGGGALLLGELISRPTEDLDVVAVIRTGKLRKSRPFPPALVECIGLVADALDLATAERDGTDWLNSGPSMPLELRQLPEGFRDRLGERVYRALTVSLPAREDHIHLKMLAATDHARASRRAVDIGDLVAMGPTPDEVRRAVTWCARLDGRPEFIELDAQPVLRALGMWEEFDV